MRFASLGSGSRGNATLLQSGDCCLLIDCGFSAREVTRRLERLSINAESISAILVTHEHGDHIRGVGPMARRYKLPVYMTKGTAHSQKKLPDELRLIEPGSPFSVDGVEVMPVPVPHDAREPVQFIVGHRKVRLGVLTDVGRITPDIKRQYARCDGLLLEANHDTGMLTRGSYPDLVKRRVRGDLGHLNNNQAADFLRNYDCLRLQQLVLGHISMQNNALDLVGRELATVHGMPNNLVYASQDNGTDWKILCS